MSFISAAEHFDLDLMKSYLSKGSSINEQNDFGDTALHICLFRQDFVRFLLSAKASPNIQNNIGSTVLHKAVVSNDKRLIATLLKAGANTNIKNHNNFYPEHYAMYFDIFKTLVGEDSVQITVPLQQHSGKIIGKKGKMLQKLKMETGAFIEVPKDSKEPIAIINGREESVNNAKKMIYNILYPKKQEDLIQDDPTKKASVKLNIAKQHFGRIIGRKGQTLKSIQKEYNVSIIMPKMSDKTSEEISIYGENIDCVSNAVKRIHEIVKNTDYQKQQNSPSNGRGRNRKNQSTSRPIPQKTSNSLPINHL